MKSLIILASGGGSNARRIIQHFKNNDDVHVGALISDRKNSGALEMAETEGIQRAYIPKSEIKEGHLLSFLQEQNPDLIVLAGFLALIPKDVVERFPNRIINLHPSLLPNYGGPGMYGMNVHRAVIDAGEKQSGISIHYVNEEYDKGQMIAQCYCSISAADNPESLQNKVQVLEHFYLPLVIENLLQA